MNDFFDTDNPKCLTPDKLRSFPGCEHYSDEEAPEVIASIEQLSHILMEFVTEMEQIGAYDKNGKLIEDHPVLVRREEALFGKPKEPKKIGSKAKK